jgi:hypothetical protein
MRKRDAGIGRLGALLLLLPLLGGVGAWNYHRNLEIEKAEPRPYRGLSEANLADLAEALQAELDAYTRRYQKATGRKVDVRDAQLLGEQVREFERVQAVSRDTRELGEQLSKTQGSLHRVQQEQRKRDAERDRLRLTMRRLLSFS